MSAGFACGWGRCSKVANLLMLQFTPRGAFASQGRIIWVLGSAVLIFLISHRWWGRMRIHGPAHTNMSQVVHPLSNLEFRSCQATYMKALNFDFRTTSMLRGLKYECPEVCRYCEMRLLFLIQLAINTMSTKSF